MIAEFFDITKESAGLFGNMNIIHTETAEEMNRWPVIFISFADAKGSCKLLCSGIKTQLLSLWNQNERVFSKLSRIEKDRYDSIYSYLSDTESGNLDSISDALLFLVEKMRDYYSRDVIVLLDEYDTPFIEAKVNGFYEAIRNELSVLLSKVLKGCSSVRLALLTGIERVAKDNIFSGLNNLDVCTVCDDSYAEYFGFTEEETGDMLQAFHMSLSDEVRKMYDGYHFGNYDIYNPWSISRYIQNKKLALYWVNTASNHLIRNALKESRSSFKKEYEQLILKGTITTKVRLDFSFYEMKSDETLWGLFVNAGYLTIQEES